MRRATAFQEAKAKQFIIESRMAAGLELAPNDDPYIPLLELTSTIAEHSDSGSRLATGVAHALIRNGYRNPTPRNKHIDAIAQGVGVEFVRRIETDEWQFHEDYLCIAATQQHLLRGLGNLGAAGIARFLQERAQAA